jgi:ABC-type lipoprotein release transport system permease subunit
MKYYYITSYQYDGVFSSIDFSSKEFFLIGLCVFLILLFGTISLSGAISRKKQEAAILENEKKLKAEVELL